MSTGKGKNKAVHRVDMARAVADSSGLRGISAYFASSARLCENGFAGLTKESLNDINYAAQGHPFRNSGCSS